MPTFRFLIAYDGTRYGGWQRQRNAPTVQATLETALRRLTGRRVVVIGAGRTDAGVHAWGQVGHATVAARLPPRRLRQALNALLPPDILIRRVTRAPVAFHAQFQAARKWYRYRIATGPVRPLFDRPYVYYVPQPLDLAAMQRAARRWHGRHDFRAFHSAGRAVADTRRTLSTLRLTRRGGELQVDLKADGFLYHMVRRMVGALILVGQGKPWPAVAPTAPARGLCLMRVTYRAPRPR